MLKAFLRIHAVTNKDTVELYMNAFSEMNHEKILSCLTEDVIWEIPGDTRLQGKAEFDAEIQTNSFERKAVIYTDRMFEDNNTVIVEGNMKGQLKNGNYKDIMFCNVFEMKNFKIKKLISYLVPT